MFNHPSQVRRSPWIFQVTGSPAALGQLTDGRWQLKDITRGGSGGCNRYQASYQRDGHSLVFGPVMSTRMACPDEKIMEQETRCLALLEVVRAYKFADYQGRTGLEMYDQDELRILSFADAPAVGPDAGTEGMNATSKQISKLGGSQNPQNMS